MNQLKPKDLETPYSFQDRFQGIQRIAIIYPEQVKWMRIARYALQKLFRLPDQFEFLLLVPLASSRPMLSVDYQYADMLYQPNKEERLAIRSRILAFNPDILFQLEPKPGGRLSKTIKLIDTPLKIGFGTEASGLNIIYSQKESGFYEKNILNLIALIERKQSS